MTDENKKNSYVYKKKFNISNGMYVQLFSLPTQEELNLKLNPSFKYNSYYRSCPDKTKKLEKKFPNNEFSVDNLCAHFYTEYSGKVLMSNGHLGDGLNTKIFFYISNSVDEEQGPGLRTDYLEYLIKKDKNGETRYEKWHKEKNKCKSEWQRPVDLMVLFRDIKNGKNYYIWAKDIIEYYINDTTLDNRYRNHGSDWYYFPIEFLKEKAYWIVDAPGCTEEDEEIAYKKLKECKRAVMREDGSWESIKVNSEPNFDLDKSDRGSFIRNRIQFTKHRRGSEQFLAIVYDKNGKKVNHKGAEKLLKSKRELFELAKEKLGYDKDYRTFCREDSPNSYKNFLNKGIEFNGYILYIQSSEEVDVEQDFTNTCLNKIHGKWFLAFLKDFVEKIMKAGNEIVYSINKLFFKKYVSKNFILSLQLHLIT